MSKLNLKPGDRAMLVSVTRWSNLLSIRPVTIKAVTPGGRISIDGGTSKFRPDGTRLGEAPYINAPQLQAWDDALWERFQTEQANMSKVHKMRELLEMLSRISNARNHAETAALWDSLPESIKALGETKEGAQ